MNIIRRGEHDGHYVFLVEDNGHKYEVHMTDNDLAMENRGWIIRDSALCEHEALAKRVYPESMGEGMRTYEYAEPLNSQHRFTIREVMLWWCSLVDLMRELSQLNVGFSMQAGLEQVGVNDGGGLKFCGYYIFRTIPHHRRTQTEAVTVVSLVNIVRELMRDHVIDTVPCLMSWILMKVTYPFTTVEELWEVKEQIRVRL